MTYQASLWAEDTDGFGKNECTGEGCSLMKWRFLLSHQPVDRVWRDCQLANGRCDQENVIEQLKNGVNAMRMAGG